jgi:hypothetical protein
MLMHVHERLDEWAHPIEHVAHGHILDLRSTWRLSTFRAEARGTDLACAIAVCRA